MKDKFDEFLKNEIEKSSGPVQDNGFSARVVENLPGHKNRRIDRRIIIALSSILSGIVFLIINGFSQFFAGILNSLNNLLKFNPVNPEILIVLVLFIFVVLSIPFIEINKRPI
jgi:hypothetical protein